VWIRKRKTPLTPEQCARLTEFAERQDGKRFALVRLAGQLTPLRSRGPLRTFVVGNRTGIAAATIARSWCSKRASPLACRPRNHASLGQLSARSVLRPFVQPVHQPAPAAGVRLASAGAVVRPSVMGKIRNPKLETRINPNH